MKKVLISALISLAWAALTTAQERPRPEQILQHPRLEVSLPNFSAEGLILDIGGGGEGVIGQLKGKQVVAVDLSSRHEITGGHRTGIASEEFRESLGTFDTGQTSKSISGVCWFVHEAPD